MGMVPWSPLGGGFLSGKYDRETAVPPTAAIPELPSATTPGDAQQVAEGRLNGPNPLGNTMFTDRNWAILDVVRSVAAEIGASPAQVALAWVAGRPGVDSTLIGASRPEQLANNIASLDVALSAGHLKQLEAASAPVATYPFSLFSPFIRNMVFGGSVSAWGE
jgi:aryl-alcohol dehydrogenase-like predicted oxidoreductase